MSLNRREEMITLLRGRAAVPVLSSLSECGILEILQQGSFDLRNSNDKFDENVLVAMFRYLGSLGLVQTVGDHSYCLTELGKSVIARDGAFLLLESYENLFSELPRLLTGTCQTPEVDRRRNVLGSGKLHGRKFFPQAFDFLGDLTNAMMVDLGCGDGTFLSEVSNRYRSCECIGIDASDVAIKEAGRRLSSGRFNGVVSNAEDIASWSSHVKSDARTIISMWFVVHEVAEGDADKATDFFAELARQLPNAELLVGEIVSHSSDLLAENRMSTIMPEFLLFHAISGQGVLNWDQWQNVKDSFPYQVVAEHKFDELVSGDDRIPSSFIWRLTPKKEL